jgi:ABC-type Fe3+-siderophore transport system permease subunit
MSVVAERELLTFSAIAAALGILLGYLSQFRPPIDPEYYLGYALIGGGVLLLLVTLLAWRNRGTMPLLRYVLGGLFALLLVGVMLGHDPTARLRPHGRFVALDAAPGQMPA